MFTTNRLQTHWEEAKPFIKETWPKIGDVELKRIKGDYDKFLHYLNEYYEGYPKTEASALNKMQRFLNAQDELQFQKK